MDPIRRLLAIWRDNPLFSLMRAFFASEMRADGSNASIAGEIPAIFAAARVDDAVPNTETYGWIVRKIKAFLQE